MNNIEHEIVPPKLTNNPSWDVVVTETTPLLSFFNAKGGERKKIYQIQIDKSKKFDSPDMIEYDNILENGEFVSDIKIDSSHELEDSCQYYWRARAKTPSGHKSDWSVSRFYVDTKSDDNFMNLVRANIKSVEVSGGYNAKNIIDWDDPGLVTFWQSPPPGDKNHWVKFELNKPTEISRIWILSNPVDPDGWLKNFILQSSNDSKNWKDIPDTKIKDNDTFRNIINFKPVKAKYFRLMIHDFIGYAAQINEIILYSAGKPPIPKVPNQNYVLIIGNEHNGFTFTDLEKHIESLGLNLKTITIPYYQTSMNMLDKLARKPLAIILSGNNADYPNLPMFEHNGEFEIIRESNIPILGICAGHQFLAMAYGYTRARSMGWSDISAMEPKNRMTHIKIKKDDPIFDNIKNNFIAPEIHGWTVVEPAEEFEVIASSTYIQAQKSTKRLIYGEQFHAEINVDYNEAKNYIKNFLKLALKNKK
jgi:GMP synthase-like glutamine amidotransferase